MTIKNWDNWKERIYSTYKVNLNREGSEYLLKECGMSRVLEHLENDCPDRILDATFVNNQVSLTIVKFVKVNNKVHKSIHNFILNRNHIDSVEFKY